MSGFTFETEMKVARYVALAQAAVLTGLVPAGVLTDTCNECGDHMETGTADDHVIVVDRDENQLVLIGCEGYWHLDPVAVGLPRGNWSGNALGDEMTGVESDDDLCMCGRTDRHTH